MGSGNGSVPGWGYFHCMPGWVSLTDLVTFLVLGRWFKCL
jgi:hypothetical protein